MVTPSQNFFSMNFRAVQNIVNSLVESMDFVKMFGVYPLDKETLEKFHTLQSRLKHEFDALDIETEFMNSDSTEAGFYLKKLDEYLYKPTNAVKMMLVKQEELVQRRNTLIERLKNENEEPVIVRYNMEIFQQVVVFRYDIEQYADSIIAGINKLHQMLYPAKNDSYHIPKEYQSLIDEIYQELCDRGVFDIDENQFRILIENANFSEVCNRKKAPIAYTIYILSKLMGSDWYEESAKSINLAKTRCSGANVEDWVKTLGDIVKKRKKEIDKANRK